ARAVIAEAGLAALWLATGFALVQVLLAWGAAKGADGAGGPMVMAALRRVAIVQGLLALVAFVLLVTLFVQSDMSVLLVVENSHSMKPLIYKIAGAWGNHEGSMLLWVTVLAVSGAGVALFEKRLPQGTLAATLGAQAAIAIAACAPTRSSG